MNIKKILFENSDTKYADFQRKLIPNIDPKTIIGVRTPILRKIAKEISKSDNCNPFLNNLPHEYFEENQLHIFVLSEMKDFENCLSEVERFLPFINNWATCDQLSPKNFKKHIPELAEKIPEWLESKEAYMVRFGVGMTMTYFLDENFNRNLMNRIAKIRSGEYYVNMMVAWYFATALTKQWNSAIEILETNKLDSWTHNKTIQKARESFRITKGQKDTLNNLKRKA